MLSKPSSTKFLLHVMPIMMAKSHSKNSSLGNKIIQKTFKNLLDHLQVFSSFQQAGSGGYIHQSINKSYLLFTSFLFILSLNFLFLVVFSVLQNSKELVQGNHVQSTNLSFFGTHNFLVAHHFVSFLQ